MGDSAIHALAGSVGGCVSMALTYPLVNLSTRAAVQTKKEHLTIPQAIAKTLKEEGVAGLYSGLSSSLFGIAVTNGVYYAFYEETRSILIGRRPKTSTSPSALSTSEGIIAGLLAGSITTLVTNPIWTVQTAQSTRAITLREGDDGKVKKIKPSGLEAAREIIVKDGIKGLWRGIGPALVLVINPVIQYTTFERLVSVLLTYRIAKKGITSTGTTAGTGRSSLSDWDMFMLGAVSKLVATGGTYPYIVVKSRLQAATHKYESSVKAILHILKSEGLSGLYAGLLPKLIQSVLTAAFMFVAQRRIYEAVKKVRIISSSVRLN
ncbi:mitochondrial carrier domain-containing protein [Naematelia encephala]|uniref:Mitochondrial carrier domain-containing protein n=1 Tax=Naematelia encephala TaxID=71784 RepID=A0A1Y2AJ04_9TREE|nr:mitochondrial carrier domain-containing protein [Naematelia encephala]